MRHRGVFLRPCDVLSVTALTTVTTITIKTFPNAIASMSSTPNAINVMLQGKPLEFVEFASVDSADNEGKYSINTSNQLVLIVSSVTVTDKITAGNYVWGIYVAYMLKSLQYADNIPTYVMETYNVNNYEVCQTESSSLPTLMQKIQCLDKDLDIDEGGYFYHVLTRSMM